MTVASAASVVAGTLHYAAAAGHRPEWTLAAVLFTLVGAFQIVWPAALRTVARVWVLFAGAAVNATVVALWVLSRTAGLPIGHHAGSAESVGALDAASSIAEVAVVITVVLTLRRTGSGAPR